MAEAIGLAASIWALGEIGFRAIKFINDIKNAGSEQRAIAAELNTLVVVLLSLRQQIESLERQQTDGQLLKRLEYQLLPLLQTLQKRLEEVATHVDNPQSKREKLKWIWKKEECKDFRAQLGVVLDGVQITLEHNNLNLIVAIKQNVDLIPGLDGKISQISSQVKKALDVVTNSQDDHVREQILKWLSPWNHADRHDAACKHRIANSGGWFMQNPVFQSWFHTQGGILWCSGVPGAGKTVLMYSPSLLHLTVGLRLTGNRSSAIDYLRQQLAGNSKVGIAFIYFESTGQDELKYDDVICNIYKQVMSQTTTVPYDLKDTWEANGKVHNRSPDCTKVLSLLRYEATQRQIYIVLDALDECVFADLIRIVKTLQSLESKINLLMASRNLDLTEDNIHIRPALIIEADQSDMESYIQHRLQQDRVLAQIVAKDPGFGQEITRTVLEKAQKTFLLLKIHMDSLSLQGKKKDVRDRLACLPKDFDKIYDEVMDRIRDQINSRRELAIEALLWISYATRPLRVTEMVHAIAIEVDKEEFNPENQVEFASDIISSCAGLVKINPTDQTVQFVHETVREYFERQRDSLFPSARVDITKKCLSYLLYEDTGHTSWNRDELLARYPFIGYAACHWGNHARGKAEESSDVQSKAFQLLEMTFRASDGFTDTRDPLPADKALQLKQWSLRHTFSALHVASKFGLNRLLSILLQRQVDPNQLDDHGQTALHWACVDGHKDTVEFLLDHGADIDAKTAWNHSTALNLASVRGFMPIVKLLIERGANPNVPCLHGPPGIAALHGACNNGHFEIARYLLDHGADIEIEKTQDARGNRVSVTVSTLQPSMKIGMDMFQLLIDKGAVIREIYCFRCVRTAIERRQPEFIRTLMMASADIHWTPEGARSNIESATWNGHILSIAMFHEGICADCGDDDITWATKHLTQQSWFTDTTEQAVESIATPSSNPIMPVKRKKYNRDILLHYDEKTQQPYVGIVIPADFPTVQQITISITSHDQGFSGDASHHGTYEHSYTWFALFVQFRGETPPSHIEHTIQHNMHASGEWRTHRIDLRCDGQDPYIADTVRRLRSGDILQVLARARFPAWVNYVQSMEVELVA